MIDFLLDNDKIVKRNFMKYLVLVLSLTLAGFVSCSPKDLASQKSSCESQNKRLITVVDNCSVYEVKARFVNENKYCESKTFLYTSCKQKTVTYSCGKNCEESNVTIK